MTHQELQIVGYTLGVNIYESKIHKRIPRHYFRNKYLISGEDYRELKGEAPILLKLVKDGILGFFYDNFTCKFYVVDEGIKMFENQLKIYLQKLNLFPVEE